MRFAYQTKALRADTLATIEQANSIIAAYALQGFDLTLRQLYYQFVARDLMGNTVKNYGKLGRTINDARLCGLIDWDVIVDRTRNLQGNSHWSGIGSVLRSAARSYRINLWVGQPFAVEVWIEKDALIGVIERTCEQMDVPYYACRGYVSASEMWAAGERIWLRCAEDESQRTIVLHLGDHDPSGIDMTRDLQQRLDMFTNHMGIVTVRRIALNMAQIIEINPPPNPAKETDTRFKEYREKYGDRCWELDAIEPAEINKLIQDHVTQIADMELIEQRRGQQQEEREALFKIAESNQ